MKLLRTKECQSMLEKKLKLKASVRPHLLNPIIQDIVYEILGKFLKEEGPSFAVDIEEQLLRDKINGWPSDITSRLAKYTNTTGKKYGINAMTLKDAIKKVYGESYDIYDVNYTKRGIGGIRLTSNILYCSEKSLVDFIKINSSSRTVLVIDTLF